jgi:hypothetical protein
MDDHKQVSVSRIYVPNEYSVWLAQEDRAQFADYETSLRGELQEYLAEHARREGFMMLTPPVVLFESDEDLMVGEFGIATRMVQPEGKRRKRDEPAAEVEPGHTMIYRPRASAQETEAVTPEELGMEREVVALSWDGQRVDVTKRRIVIGRSKDCDVQLSDANVSRRHAELRQEGATYWIVDLQSTNGIEVNGTRETRAKLENGDRITLGSTELTFTREVP